MEEDAETYTVKFHHDSYVSVCKTYGYSIYELNKNLKFGLPGQSYLARLIFEDKCKYLKFVEPLHLYNKLLIAVIEGRPHGNGDNLEFLVAHPRRSIYWNLRYDDPVLSCTSSNNKLVVCLEKSICIYTILDYEEDERKFVNTMSSHHVIITESNPKGVLALGQIYFAYPESPTSNAIKICGITSGECVSIIVHGETLSILAFDSTENYIATASKCGSVILVYSCLTKDGQAVFKFLRGIVEASISSLSFSPDSVYLGCTSNTQTIHIFNLLASEQAQDQNKHSLLGTLTKLLPERAYYTAKLPKVNLNSCLMIESNCAINVFVMTNEGMLKLYSYSTSGAKGVELELIKEELLNVKVPEDISEDLTLNICNKNCQSICALNSTTN